MTAYYYLFLGLLTFIYLICSIRTNMCLFTALFLLVITFCLVAGAFFQTANGAHALAEKLLVVSHHHKIEKEAKANIWASRPAARSISPSVSPSGTSSSRRSSRPSTSPSQFLSVI